MPSQSLPPGPYDERQAPPADDVQGGRERSAFLRHPVALGLALGTALLAVVWQCAALLARPVSNSVLHLLGQDRMTYLKMQPRVAFKEVHGWSSAEVPTIQPSLPDLNRRASLAVGAGPDQGFEAGPGFWVELQTSVDDARPVDFPISELSIQVDGVETDLIANSSDVTAARPRSAWTRTVVVCDTDDPAQRTFTVTVRRSGETTELASGVIQNCELDLENPPVVDRPALQQLGGDFGR